MSSTQKTKKKYIAQSKGSVLSNVKTAKSKLERNTALIVKADKGNTDENDLNKYANAKYSGDGNSSINQSTEIFHEDTKSRKAARRRNNQTVI